MGTDDLQKNEIKFSSGLIVGW